MKYLFLRTFPENVLFHMAGTGGCLMNKNGPSVRCTKGPGWGQFESEQFLRDRWGGCRVPARGGIYRSGFVGWCVPRRSREFVLFMLIFPWWKTWSIHTDKASNEFPSKPFPYSIY